MVVKSEVADIAVVDASVAPKIVASIESVVCSSFDDSETPQKEINSQEEPEDRNDLSAMCFAENPCMDARNALLTRNDIVRTDASPDHPTSSKRRSKTHASPNTVAGTGGLFFDKLCAQPYDMLVSATSSAAHTEKSASDMNEVGENEQGDNVDDDVSEVSTSVITKMFDDLASLPSLASVGVNKFQEDSESFLSQVEDLVFSTEEPTDEKASTETITSPPIPTVNSEHLEASVEQELDATAIVSDKELKSNYSSHNRHTKLPRVWSSSSRTKESAKTYLTDELSSTEALIRKLRAAREEHGRYDLKCADLTAGLGDEFYKDGAYDRAHSLYKEAMSVYSTKLGDFHETTIACRVHLGDSLEKLGRYDAAIREYHAVLEMRKELKGEKDSSVGDVLVMISKTLRQKEGRLPQALKELKQALKLYRSSLGDSDPKVAETVDDIASLYMECGNYTKAAAILDEVVKLKVATSGMLNASVADTLLRLGIAQQSSGDLESALKSLKKAFSIYTSVRGEDSEEATTSLQNLARLYMEFGDYQKATNACMGVLNRQKRTIGNTDPRLADTYLNLGLCLRQTRDLNKASKCLKLALTLCIGAKGKETRDPGTIAQIMHELGVIHQLNGKTSDAIKVFVQELVVRRKMGNKELPQVARTLFYLGTAKYDLAAYIPALSYLAESLEIYKQLENDFGMDYAETLFSAALVFKTTKQDERARQAFLESLKLFYAHGLGNDHELVKMAAGKLKELGHDCKCPYRVCTQIPCQSSKGAKSLWET